MIYVKNIHIPKHLQVICLRKRRISTTPLRQNFIPKHPKQPIKAQEVTRTERCPFRKTFSHRTFFRNQRTRKRIYQRKRGLYIIEEKEPIYNKEKTEETTKQRKEIINKRRDYKEKRITRRGNSQEEKIHKKREFTRRGFVRKDEINEEKV